MANHDETARLLEQLEQQFTAIGQTFTEIATHLKKPPTEHVARFLPEPQMAAHLGITKRAIQHRRLRGQIPPSVVQKIGPEWIYSVDRYEAWLDSLWPAPTPSLKPRYVPDAKTNKRLNRSRHGTEVIITKLV
ncbi:helix-turn-helix transcriptional regulator [Stutzerimonas stutzeri]|uniref:helix-turn-helix transcriptional regulator n=1 Tax=Stutzerimonas stutzeri TaxID=316 RepID=UPI0017853851|nr:hypothetical protein [Stutzerimonas stutzeri]MBD9411253.1 hypothetical protein [Stutzerimonas stutzeri]